jgi:ribonucleotide reductase alpha subunit
MLMKESSSNISRKSDPYLSESVKLTGGVDSQPHPSQPKIARKSIHVESKMNQDDFKFSDHALSLLSSYYMGQDEQDPTEAFRRAAYSFTPNKELAERLYEYVCKGWFMFSSPVLSNAGRSGLPISCFLSYVEDSITGLISHTEELRWMSVMGGGVGGHWDGVRSVSNKSPGPIPFIKTVDADMVAYRQGLTRKGSYAAYLDVSHPDLVEFLNLRLPTGGDTNRKAFNINNALNITDAFMEAVLKGKPWDLIDPNDGEVRDTLDARELWQRILEVRFRTGEPYLNFIDEANRHLPQPLKDKGLKIHGSNLCVRGDTQILTDKGYYPIQSLAGKRVKVWNGKTWSTSLVAKTGENENLLKIRLSNGSELYTTPYHKFYTVEGVEVQAQNLEKGLALKQFSLPVVAGEGSWENPYSLGFYLYDATAPVNLDLKTRVSWLSGFIDARGSVEKPFTPFIQINHSNYDFMRQVALMLNTMGVAPILEQKPTHTEIKINPVDVQRLKALGLETQRLVVRSTHVEGSHKAQVEVMSVEPCGVADTYCFNEPQRHMGILNGILTGNCNEIHLPTSPERSAVCCLSSLNLEHFDEWCDTTIVEDLIEFLDDVLQYFIDNAPHQLSKAIFSAKSERSLGLGTMGFHAYLQRKGLPFESALAVGVNRRIFSTIKEKAVQATERLAKEKGEYLDGIGSGRRNSHLLAIAPNANSAIILDTSPSIEPWKSNAFTHRTRAGSFLQFNKYLEELLKTKEGIDFEEVKQSIILSQGSVQHLECLTDWEKQIFKTAFELDQMWVVEHASVRQEWICQGQSVNLFFPSGSDINYVSNVHLSAWKKKLKGLYYLRTNTGVVADKVSEKVERQALKDFDECLSCQG